MTKRRDTLKGLLEPVTRFSVENAQPRPRAPIGSGALQSINHAISGIAEEAHSLRKALSDGQMIVEIEPDVIGAAFIRDRLGEHEGPEFESLVESIRERGQLIPVMVRPHPTRAGHFQLAFGHRRVAAARRLGVAVKAIVRDLSDDELVIAQGSENLERKDLSFIERAVFASRLEDHGMSRTVIMATLGTSSKGVLSEMISLVRRLPRDLIEAIGPAPGIGRPRWEVLASTLAANGAAWSQVTGTDNFGRLPSVERFEAIYAAIKAHSTAATRPEKKDTWNSQDTRLQVTIDIGHKKSTLTIAAKDGPSFAEFVGASLDELYANFKKKSGD